MAYVYRHVRHDKNVPFYIGIGNDDNQLRATSKQGRNPHWDAIVNKSEYSVEILLDGITWEFACKKEIEFIALYKRVKDGGVLCNITLGGEGQLGLKPKNAFQKGHLSSPLKGKKLDPIWKEKLHSARRGIPSWNKGISPTKESIEKQLKTKKELGKIPRGADHPRFGKTHTEEQKAKWRVSRKGATPWNVGKKWDRDKITDKMREAQNGNRIEVYQYDVKGGFIEKYMSVCEASEKTGVGKGNISHCLKNNRKSSGGYKWSLDPLE